MTEDTWEYRYEVMGGFLRSFDMDRRVRDMMNRRGSEGWELVSFQRARLTHRYWLVFKRRIKPATARSAP